MPTLVYLSMKSEQIFTDEWQVYVLLSIVAISIVAVAVVIYKTRKW